MFEIKSISKANFLSWLATIMIISAIFMGFFIYEKILDFRKSSGSFQKSYVHYQKQIISNEAQNALKYLGKEMAGAGQDASGKALAALKSVGFGRNPAGDIFVLSQSGTILMHPESPGLEGKSASKLFGSDGRSVFDELVSGYNAGAGRYSSYQSLDSSNREPSENWVYAVPFKQYGWLVCSSVNENEVRMAYGENSGRLEIDLIMEIAFICILGLLVTCAAIIFSISVSRVMKNEIDLLVAYFRDCFKKEAVLSENQLRFNEFRFIGSAAVAMVTQIKELIRRVKDLAIKAEMNSQIKSAYLSTMSHQFRNPVNGVLGMTQLLADTNLTDEQKGYVRSIEISANSLTGLVEDIDDYADIGTGPLELDILPFEPRGIAEEVVLLLNRQAIDKKIKLELHVDQNVPKYLLGDSERLKQILTVLVRNAIYFTNEGGVRIETSSGAGGEKITGLTFKVVDTGIGISEGKLLAVFDFTHEEYSKSRKFAAVGLSLAVCRQLVEAMSGKISVESTKGKGSAFSFSVPLGIADGQKMADELKKKGDASASGTYSGVKVLVAEDDPINRSVALKLMAKLGITVETAVNGAEAFRKFSSSRYDIVFMDCEMPEVDGFTATGNIRKKEAEDKSGHVPVVAMTAYAMRGDREMCFEAGMDDHIAKPVTKELLIKILNKYVRKEG